jgi:hypothetical protein
MTSLALVGSAPVGFGPRMYGRVAVHLARRRLCKMGHLRRLASPQHGDRAICHAKVIIAPKADQY